MKILTETAASKGAQLSARNHTISSSGLGQTLWWVTQVQILQLCNWYQAQSVSVMIFTGIAI